MKDFKGLTTESVVNELSEVDDYEDIVQVGVKVKRMIRTKKNSPFLPMDVYEKLEDRMKARSFLMGVICSQDKATL